MKARKIRIDELADEIIRVEYPTYEQTTIPQMKNAILRNKYLIKLILKQHLESAIRGLLQEIKREKERYKEIKEVVSGLCIAEEKIKKWFPDVET